MSRENNIIWKSLIASQKTIMLVTGIGNVIIVAAAMLLRFFLNIDFKGYEEILAMVAMWSYMMGSSYGAYEGSHIQADILTVYMKEGKMKSLVLLIQKGLSFGFGIVFMVWALNLALWAIEMDTRTPVWRLPMAIGQCSLFIGVTLMNFYMLVYFIDQIKATIRVFKGANCKEGVR